MLFRIIRNIVLYFIVRRVLALLFLVLVGAYFLHGGGGGGGGFLANAWHSASRGLNSVVSTVQAEPSRSRWHDHVTGPAPESHPVERGSAVANGFSPGNAEPLVIQAIDQAQHSIDMAAYSFTSRPIAAALIGAKARGVAIRVVVDKSQGHERYSKATFLMNAGIPVRIDDRYAIMHNKFMVIDGSTVETGSFNFTAAAAVRNAENVLVLRGMPQLAASYAAEWRRLWDESSPYAGHE
jgi:phosphatidylserine/phosphatidylglycerophosphate/cardiolipin synthase-like enzyme